MYTLRLEKCEFINENLSSHSAEIEPIKKQIELFQIDLEEKMEIANITATEWQVITEAQDEFKVMLVHIDIKLCNNHSD